MPTIRLASPTDFDGWRKAARSLRLSGAHPATVHWGAQMHAASLLEGLEPSAPLDQPPVEAAFSAPREFLDLARSVILHRDEDRFDLLYRLLWRLRDEPSLMHLVTDPDVARALGMRKQVSHAIHKMHAFVRFRRVADDDQDPDMPETYVAWFEPPHRVLEAGVGYFVKRMANLRFSILSPDACVHWDGRQLAVTAGADKALAPEADALEDHWRTYFSSIFNPARLNPKLMAQHMPKAYWRNLPEAEVIPQLIERAQGRTKAMVEAAPTQPSVRARRIAARQPAPAPASIETAPTSLSDIAAAIQACRRCDLWRDATQGVAGQGPAQAAVMFVGEQPGDQEDLAGRPFVGPAGAVFDRALAEAGVPRDQTYVTNAVKHFKHEPRGKRRLHKTPDAGEVQACRWWLDHERRLVKPKLIVTLGGTAASTVFGRSVAVTKERGPAGELEGGAQGFITVHPSMLLRIPDPEAKAKAYEAFVRDLAAAWALVG